MRELYTEEKVMLKLLSERWLINLFDTYQSESLSVAQLAQFVGLYKEKGYIRRYKLWIVKTIKGYIKIKHLAPMLYRMSENSWKQVPEKVIKKRIEPNKPFYRMSFRDIN